MSHVLTNFLRDSIFDNRLCRRYNKQHGPPGSGYVITMVTSLVILLDLSASKVLRTTSLLSSSLSI